MDHLTHKRSVVFPPTRYEPDRDFARGMHTHPAATPVTLLIPRRIDAQFRKRLLSFRRRQGAYLFVLLRNFRRACLEGEIMQSGALKTRYQKPGQELRRYCVRVNNEFWMELGVWADYVGVSRAHLFVWLVEKDLDPGDESAFVGVPTKGLHHYDFMNPGYIEYRSRVFINQNRYERHLGLRARPEKYLPGDIRLKYFLYPEKFDGFD